MKIRPGVLIGVWCLCAATAVRADYPSEFREGVKALNVGSWNEAVRRFRLAMQDNPKETGERVDITSGDFEPYFPHALLGLALYSTGRCDQAPAAFEMSRAQKAPWSRSRRETALVRAEMGCPPPAAPAGPNPAILKASLQRAGNALATDFRSEFREGVKALNFRNWNEAIRRFRLAIQGNPQDTGDRVDITSSDFEPYFPHALLGLALYSTGRCDQALPEFQISRAQKAQWSRSRRESALVRAEKACPPPAGPAGPDPALFQAALQRADKAFADAGEVQREVAALGKDPALEAQWSTNARLGPALTAADAQLAGARRTLDEARKSSDSQGAAAAQQSAENARDKFATIRTAAKELAAPPPLPTIAVNNGTKPIGAETPVGSGRGPVTPPQPPAKPQATVPPRLASAAGQFFRAQYSNAANVLSAEKFDRVEDALQAEWFKAASYYSLYLLSGRTDETSRTRAEEHVRTCRRLQPSFLPDRGFFSPVLIAFYQSVR